MFLAYVLNKYEEYMIADFAEYYNIYEYRDHPIERVAILLKHLPQNSRVYKEINKIEYDFNTLINARMLDALNILVWSKTKDGINGRNKPKSVYELLVKDKNDSKDDIVSFASGKEFEKEKRKIIENIEKGGTH